MKYQFLTGLGIHRIAGKLMLNRGSITVKQIQLAGCSSFFNFFSLSKSKMSHKYYSELYHLAFGHPYLSVPPEATVEMVAIRLDIRSRQYKLVGVHHAQLFL